MKSVDVTLIIQACNFFVAYYFLRTYVFYPCSQILEEREQQEQKLQKSIEEARAKHDNAIDRMKNRLQEIKQLLLNRVPAQATSVFDVKGQPQGVVPQPVALSDQQCQKIKQTISERISKVTL